MSLGTLKIPKPMTVFVSSISGKYLSESLYECCGLNYIKYQRVQHVLLWGKKKQRQTHRHTEKERGRQKRKPVCHWRFFSLYYLRFGLRLSY